MTNESEQDNNRTRQEKGWAVDRGQRREQNEDSVAAVDMNMVDSDAEKSVGIYTVADGMGGEQHGEVASSAAVHTVVDQITQRISVATGPVAADYQQWLEEAVQTAHKAIVAQQQKMGTTLVASIVVGDTAFIANVGDSRAYLLSRDGMQQITRDHSLVQALLDSGAISEEQAEHHPYRNVLRQAVGSGDDIKPDLHTAALGDDHCLLLCSDGLTNEVDEKTIHETVLQAESPQAACDALVQKANANGGNDNISVIIVNLSALHNKDE